MSLAAVVGFWARRSFMKDQGDPDTSGQEAYIVSAVLGLLALLMGFTLSLSLDRFETRRALVLEEANAIGTAYLRTQLLREPHRGRLTDLLVSYIDNRLAFAKTDSADERRERLAADDQLTVDLWAATAAAFDEIRSTAFSTGYLDSINAVLDLDTSRRTAGAARVPAEVFGMLALFTLVASGLLGFVLTGPRRRITATFLLLLMALALSLMLDIDRPSAGLVVEWQEPLEALRASISAHPPDAYDRWRTPPA
ncbi:hypothetical protein PRN20_09460 [Devosia sp. ZB163]|uniref:bestrophin-like domain n=1 Tax=Devosia sp. ZB163 TaxID=3025938 RepID=UPI0023603033|nr:hypothetical protein [Devosia sp. ZB163]MDC9823962.1 hypothetical protein [Devosia sp. ZB163]